VTSHSAGNPAATNRDNPRGSRLTTSRLFLRGRAFRTATSSELQQSGKRSAQHLTWARIGHSFSTRLPDSYGVDLRTHQRESRLVMIGLGMGLLIGGMGVRGLASEVVCGGVVLGVASAVGS
jgi:hypothetical protein